MDSIKLRKFDPSVMSPQSVVLLVGKRGTGKSTLSLDIFWYLRQKFDAGICFSATEESNKYWSKYIPDTLIHPEYNSEKYGKFLNEQRRINSTREKPINSFVLLEDCMGDRQLKKCKHIRSSFFNGRHYGLFFLMTMQYVMDLGPELRSNCDFIIVLKNNFTLDRERIWKNFAGMVPNFQLFQKIFNRVTSGWDCMVIDNTSRSNEICDCIFWYRAEIRKDFKIGRLPMWHLHYRLKNENEKDQKNEDDDLKDILQNNSLATNIRVQRLLN